MTYYKPEWLEEDRKRVTDMQRWYILDGRHRPEHPYHNLYTNLMEIGKKLDDEMEYE